jgi:outer membrane receptor protein involved in Fe transport
MLVMGARAFAADAALVDAVGAGGSEDGRGLQEVIVSATKRNEDLQDVPLSITALSRVQLEDRGVEQFFDYGNSVPNLSFAIGAADGSLAARGVAIRGIQGSNTTGFYIDDTPVLETLDPHIVDIARIEVLRGPQGTLYGAESMGGTVRIITEQPNLSATSGQLHASGSGTDHGSFNDLLEGDVNQPLIDDVLAVRASAFYQKDSGYFNKGIGPEPGAPAYTQHDVGSMEYYGGQIALRWEPLSGLALTPRIMYQRIDQDGVPYATYTADNLTQRQIFNIPEGGTDKWWLASLTVNYTVPWGTFVSSTGYFHRETFEREDDTDTLSYFIDVTPPIPGPITREIDLHRFAQEFRFASTFSGPVQAVAGGFYSDSTRPRDYEWTGQGLGAATGWPNDDALTFIDSRTAKEYAVFGDLSYSPIKELTFTAGVRWFRDTATFTQYTDGLFYGGASTYLAPETAENGFTPKYLIEYKLTPDLLLYTSAAKGFREGGNNISLPAGPPPTGCDRDLANLGLTRDQVVSYKSDSLWNYEIGEKWSFGDRRFTLNIAGFWIEWSNIQQQVELPECGYGFTGNSGKARSRGGELEFSGKLTPNLTLGIGAGYTDAVITQAGLDSPQLPGSPVYNVPKLTATSSLEYSRPLTVSWSGFARADYSYVGDSYSANNSQITPLHRAGYDIVNLRLGARTERFEVAAFVKNLTNEHANLADAIMIGAQYPDRPSFVINQPFTAGVEGRWRF